MKIFIILLNVAIYLSFLGISIFYSFEDKDIDYPVESYIIIRTNRLLFIIPIIFLLILEGHKLKNNL